jgi:hypothetical protein
MSLNYSLNQFANPYTFQYWQYLLVDQCKKYYLVKIPFERRTIFDKLSHSELQISIWNITLTRNLNMLKKTFNRPSLSFELLMRVNKTNKLCVLCGIFHFGNRN